MGLRASKQDKQTKANNDEVKERSIASNKAKLLALKSRLLGSQTLEDKSSASTTSLVVTKPEASLFIVNTAIQQLDRKGKHLIKADLVALIISLRPEYVNMIEELQTSFTVEDLNSLIRSIIYDPDYLANKAAQNVSNHVPLPMTNGKENKMLKGDFDIIQ